MPDAALRRGAGQGRDDDVGAGSQRDATTRTWHDAPVASREDLVDEIAGFGLFADLSTPQLTSIAHTFEEMAFGEGDRILRQGLTGSGFHVILDGEAVVAIDGNERARLARGDFFGEVSILLGEPPIADITATRALRCLVLAAPLVEDFLIAHPRVLYRMLQAQSRRLRAANRWRS
jgi:CRP-like cAMP-binding protein